MKRVKRVAVAVAAVAVIVLVALTFTNYAPAYLVRVDGQSMEPTLHNGEMIVAVRRPVAVGDVVVFHDAFEGLMVKRVLIAGPQWLYVMGDNRSATGTYPVKRSQVRGVCLLWPVLLKSPNLAFNGVAPSK